jgi:hypothetical protein
MTRGDRRRNVRRERLRGVLPRKTVRVKAFRPGLVLDWAVAQTRAKGFASVAVACEPAGARWLQVQRLCAERELPLVCIQPLVSHVASGHELVIYPREGHGLVERNHQLDLLRRTRAWFGRWLS